MSHAARIASVCLMGLLGFGCVARQTAIRQRVPPPPPPPEGQQSLEDLDRALSSGGPVLVASVERSEHMFDKSAVVKVTVVGLGIVDPQLVGEAPRYGQGHLHYQIDGGPVIATTATKLAFHELTPGRHTVVVLLAGNDHQPLGPKRILTVNIPSDGKSNLSPTRKRARQSKAPVKRSERSSAR